MFPAGEAIRTLVKLALVLQATTPRIVIATRRTAMLLSNINYSLVQEPLRASGATWVGKQLPSDWTKLGSCQHTSLRQRC